MESTTNGQTKEQAPIKPKRVSTRLVLSIIAGGLTVGLTVVQLTLGLGDLYRRVKDYFSQANMTILIGFTAHGVWPETEKLEEYYRAQIITPANVYLRKRGRHVLLQSSVPPASYDRLFDALKDKKVDLAFTSPYNYLHTKYYRYRDTFASLFQVVGAKTDKGNAFYLSWLIMPKGCEASCLPQQSRTVVSATYPCRVFLGTEDTSASTYVVPYVHLLERGVLLDSTQPNFERIERSDMLQRIKDAGRSECAMGVTSDQDWARHLSASERSGLTTVSVPVQIPFDPVVVLKDRWRHLDASIAGAVIEALASTSYVTPTESWAGERFVEYVASGVVIGQSNSGRERWEVLLPEPYYDLLTLRALWNDGSPRVCVVREVHDRGVSGVYSAHSEVIGEGVFARTGPDRGIVTGVKAEGSLQGSHVLPDHVCRQAE